MGYYYLQSRYYDPAVGRFLNADDSRMIGISGTPTSNNIYIYCRNSPVDNSDPTGYWAEKYYGFKWTSKGFNVYANTDFLSQWYCLSFADDILAQKGQWYGWVKRYRGMSRIRIAQEVWFHAVFYYVGSPVKTILSCLGVSWKWLNDNLERAKYIEVNYDDERSWVYAFAWQ